MRKKELENLLEASERGKKEMFFHFNEKISALREELKSARTGASQINAALNSILIGAALDQDGTIHIPKNHLNLLEMWDYDIKDNGQEYIFTVSPKRKEEKNE